MEFIPKTNTIVQSLDLATVSNSLAGQPEKTNKPPVSIATQKKELANVFERPLAELEKDAVALQKFCFLQRNDMAKPKASSATFATNETYGETTFWSIVAVLGKLISAGILNTDDTIESFCDIGCGIGNVLFSVDKLFDTTHLLGYEVNSALQTQPIIDRIAKELPNSIIKSENVLETLEWTNSNIVFTHSICFEPSLMLYLVQNTKHMKHNSIFICMQPISSQEFPWIRHISKMKLSTSYSSGYFYTYKIHHE